MGKGGASLIYLHFLHLIGIKFWSCKKAKLAVAEGVSMMGTYAWRRENVDNSRRWLREMESLKCNNHLWELPFFGVARRHINADPDPQEH
jgi:hypothetical protein